MSKKNKPGNGVVYSTNPAYSFEPEQSAAETLPPNQQRLRVRMETKHRAGKTVTVIAGFFGTVEDLEALGKKLKNHCGTGGSAKDNEIIVQGDHREKVVTWLKAN